MNGRTDPRYLTHLGQRIFSEANDLKRTPEALAREIGIDFETVQAVIGGKADVATARTVVDAMLREYPVSVADLWVEPDDTDDGVKVMRAEDSRASSRVFDRKAAGGGLAPFYEYRDTAMSRTAPFKPEWIQPLRVVDNADADNPDVAYNNGHLLHQCTFFIGEVNFYWRVGGRGYCAEMNTGDSNYITPFVPHSFASRNPDRLGLILAVTFAGQVRHSIDEFARIGAAAANDLAGNPADPAQAFAARLNRHMAAESVGVADLALRLDGAGIARARLQALAGGGATPTAAETRALATALHMRAEDLAVASVNGDDRVVLRFAGDTAERLYPQGNASAYRLRELARSGRQPGLKGFDVAVIAGADASGGGLRHGLHQYVYNYGEVPVAVRWDADDDERTAVIGPGDSAYMRPMVAHAFSAPAGGDDGRLAVVRVPGALTDAAIEEFAGFATGGRDRVAGETKRWF